MDMFSNQLLKYIGAYIALLGKVDAIVFSGGIGEGAWYLRENISRKLGMKIIVIPANEEVMIARESYNLMH